MKKPLLSLLASLLLIPSLARAEEKLFPLGLWYEGGVAEARDNVLPKDPKDAAKIYDQHFADIASHGINLIVVPNTPPDHHLPLLDAAQKHGLKVIPELGLDGGPVGNSIRDPNKPVDDAVIQDQFKTVLDPIKNHPAFYRLQLLDEPANGPPMKNYAHIATLLSQHAPSVKPFTCLAGIGPIAEFAATVHPDVVAFDAYPFGPDRKPNDIPTLRDYESASLAAVTEARKAGSDCWAVLQCHAITGALRFPSPEELHAMTWIAIATGNKGIFWFLYQTERFSPTQTMSGLVDRDFKPNPLWPEIANLTKELQPLTPALADLKPAEEKPTIIRRKSMYPLQDSKGNLYLIAINVDPSPAGQQTLHLSLKTPATKVFRLPANTEIPSARDPKDNDRLTWHEDFPPGAGALYRVE